MLEERHRKTKKRLKACKKPKVVFIELSNT